MSAAGALSDEQLTTQFGSDGAIPSSAMSDDQLQGIYAPKKTATVSSPPQPTSAPAPDWRDAFMSDPGAPYRAAFAPPALPNPKAPESSWGDTLLKLAQNLPSNIESGFGGLTQSLGAMPQDEAAAMNTMPGLPFTPDAGGQAAAAYAIGRPEMAPGYSANPTAKTDPDLEKYGQATYAAAQAHLKANAPNIYPDSFKSYAYDITSGLVQMAPLVAASAITRSPAPLLGGIAMQAYGDAYGAARANGRTDAQAQGDGMFSAAANALPAELPLHALMKPGQKFLGKVLSTAAGAGAQNFLTSILQSAYDLGVVKQDMTWGDAQKAMADAGRQGVIGLGTGVVLGVGAHVAGRIAEGAPDAPQPQASASPPPNPDVPAPPQSAPAPPAGQSVPEPSVPAANPQPAPAQRLVPVHDPVTWAQTGWKDPQTGEISPLASADAQGVPGAPQPQTTASGAPVTPEAALDALNTNIDPTTGVRPKGNAALRAFRAQMQTVIDQPPAPEPTSAAEPTPTASATIPPSELPVPAAAAPGPIPPDASIPAKEAPQEAEITAKSSGLGTGGAQPTSPVDRSAPAVAPPPAAAPMPFDPGTHVPALVARIRTTNLPLTIPAIAKSFDLKPQQAARVVAAVAARPTEETGARVSSSGNLRRLPVSNNPSDVAGFLAANGGISDNEGHSLVKSMGLQQFVPGRGPLIRPGGMTVDRAGEALWQAGFFGPPDATPRPDTQQVLDKLGETAGRQKVVAPEAQAAQAEQAAGARAAEDNAAALQEIHDHAKAMDVPLTDDDAHQILGEMGAHGIDAQSAVVEHVERQAQQEVESDHAATADPRYQAEAVPFHGGEGDGDLAARGGGEGRAPAAGDAGGADRARGADAPDPGAGPEITAEPGAEGLPQTVIPGAERSAVQAAAARETLGRGRMAPKVEQRAPGALFDKPEEPTPDLLDSGVKDPSFALEDGPPPFYSALTRAVEGARQERAPAQQWASMIDNAPGVKQEEVAWSGVKDWLGEQKAPVTKAALLEHLRENEVQIQDVEKGKPQEVAIPPWHVEKRGLSWAAVDDTGKEWGRVGQGVAESEAEAKLYLDRYVPIRERERVQDANEARGTKYGQYTLPGGENYRELLMTMPHARGEIAAGNKAADYAKMLRAKYGERYTARATAEERRTYDELHHQADRAGRDGEFKTGHFQEPNILAHVRFDDRTGPNGEKILHMAELQSDWAQAGRRKGFHGNLTELPDGWTMKENSQGNLQLFDPEGTRVGTTFTSKADALGYLNSRGVPDMPFKKTDAWSSIALKRMMRYAAEHGYDKLSWDTGETQNERYDLSKQVGAIHYNDVTGKLAAYDPSERSIVMERDGVKPENLPDVIGKDAAERIGKIEPNSRGFRILRGDDLKIEGEGQKGFYDKILPAAANKIGKRFGAKVESSFVGDQRVNDGYEVGRAGADFAVYRNTGGDPISRYRTENEAEAAANQLNAESSAATTRVHSIDITPQMREGVMRGQPMFARQAPAGWESAGGGGYEAPPLTRASKVKWKFTPEFDAKRAELEPALRDRLDKMGLSDIGLKLPDAIRAMNAEGTPTKVGGMYGEKMIALALDSSMDKAEVIDHEAVHAMRDLGLFTPEEWATLSRKAGDWVERYGLARRYRDYPPDKMNEEAIAHAYPDWRTGKLGNVGSAVQRIFKKVSNFFEAVGNVFRGMGFRSADDVFSRISTGEIGGRPRAESDPAAPSFAREPDDEREPGALTKAYDRVRQPLSRASIKILGGDTAALGRKIQDAADRVFSEPLKETGRGIQMAFTPMAAGRGEGAEYARAAAKDFANAQREARVIGGRQFEYLTKNFKPDELRKMWTAADERTVAAQEGNGDVGMPTLQDREKNVVEAYRKEAAELFGEAQDLDMVEGDGLPFYAAPRMVVALGADGRLGSSDKDVSYGLDAIGRNLTTTSPNLRHRAHLTAQDTETAAKSINPGAAVVRDFRTLPLAMTRLRQAIAGRRLINAIRDFGKESGELTVAEGAEPSTDSGHKWFTIDHPALKVWRPQFVRDGEHAGEVATDQDGNKLFERVPLFIRDDFEGPLRAVLSTKENAVYQGVMALKGKMMSVIMYSPLMHNAVIWGKAFPAAPIKLLTPFYHDPDTGKLRPGIALYGEGRAAMNNPGVMQRALADGLDPVGHRYFNQDASAIMEEPNLKPGRSWSAQLVGSVTGLFDKDAGENVKRAIDRAGDIWHNKLLWDLVGNLQMGLYDHMRAKAIRAGNDPQTAGRLAAHFANRYAGALPLESMSKIARQTANWLLFSRSFTLSNLGAFKDLVAGLPKDVQAQIMRDKGVEALNNIQGTARRKAAALIVMDVGLSMAGLFLAQHALAWLNGQQATSPSDNEPDKKNRFLMGYQADGTAVYGRLPTGKVGEELSDWVTEPAAVATRKLSPFGRLMYGLMANDQGFDQKIYDPHYTGVGGYVKNAGLIGKYVAEAVAPLSPFEGVSDLLRGRGDTKTNIEKLLLPMVGVTVSKGAPGGPAVGLMYRSKDEHEFQVQQAMPDIHDQIRSGDLAGAEAAMTKLGFPTWRQQFTIKTTLSPGSRLSKTQMREFEQQATPEDRAQMEQFLKDQDARRSDQHSALEPQDLPSVIADPTKLRRAADAGLTWSRQDAIRAAMNAGMPATAALLRDARDPMRASVLATNAG